MKGWFCIKTRNKACRSKTKVHSHTKHRPASVPSNHDEQPQKRANKQHTPMNRGPLGDAATALMAWPSPMHTVSMWRAAPSSECESLSSLSLSVISHRHRPCSRTAAPRRWRACTSTHHTSQHKPPALSYPATASESHMSRHVTVTSDAPRTGSATLVPPVTHEK